MACVGRGASQRFSTRAQLDDYIWLYFDDKCTKTYSCVLITKSTPDGWAGNWSIEYKSEEVDDLPSFSITWRYRMILNRPLKIKNRFRWNRSKKTLQLRSAYFSFSTTSISLSLVHFSLTAFSTVNATAAAPRRLRSSEHQRQQPAHPKRRLQS